MLYAIFSKNTTWKSGLGRTHAVDEGLIKTCRNAGCGDVMLSRSGLRPLHRGAGCLGKQMALLILPSGPLTLLPTHLEVVRGRWTVDPHLPSSLPPLPQSVHRPGSLQTLALSTSSPSACLASGPTHSGGWCKVGSVIVSESVQLFSGLDCKGTCRPLLRPTLQNPSQLKLALLEVHLWDWNGA